MNNVLLSTETLGQVIRSRAVRTSLAYRSHECFFAFYLSHYIQFPTAPLHRDFLAITENAKEKLSVIVAFRDSGKSTYCTVSYPIWAIIGQQQRKFVLILSRTQEQAQRHMSHLRSELETNLLLRGDFGAFEEDTAQWGRQSIMIPRYGARITVASSEQSIRGIRNRQFRPDLIICDDVEDLDSVATKEGRDKTFNWLAGEIFPAGKVGVTKVVIVGNLLHDDSLIMRLKDRIATGDLDGKFYSYPLVDSNGVIAWPGQFPNLAAIEQLRRSIPSESAWQREYLLKIIVDEEQIVRPDSIHYWDELPPIGSADFRYAAIGVDLAFKKKEKSDFTAMVSMMVFGRGDKMRAFILPNPINKKMDFQEMLDTATLLSRNLHWAKVYVEDVGGQLFLAQQLRTKGVPAEEVRVIGDKNARLSGTTHYIKSGQFIFPRHGAQPLIQQLTSFGRGDHDDLVDAFSMLALKVIELNSRRRARAWVHKPAPF
jgi:predicted phage terminase large subunit-like protein